MPVFPLPERWIADYARASKDREEKRISTDRQLDEGEKLANDLFPGVAVRRYCDNDITAADPDVERPDYDRMIADIRRGQVLAVVTHRQSRLTRQPSEWEDLMITLTKAKVDKVHTVLNGPIAVKPGSRVVSRIFAAIDAEEVERTKELVLDAHRTLAAEGRPSGGRTYGYRSVEGPDRRSMLVIEPDEARVVRLMSDRLIGGFSLQAVATELNQAGTPTPRGGPRWVPKVVRGVVAKPTIAGLRGHHGALSPARWEPILTEERWRQTLRALGSATVMDAAGRRHNASRAHRAAGRKWLLTSGLARCGLCREPLRVVPSDDGVPAYCCHRTAGTLNCGGVKLSPAPVVEEYVAGQVLDALDRPEMAARLTADPDPKRAALLAELADAEGSMTEAVTLKGEGVYTAQQRDAQFHPAKARAEAARSALAALPDPDVELPPADQIAKRWEAMPLRQRRALLERFLEVVEVLPATSRGRPKQSAWERVAQRVALTWRQ
jgi:DNA invertase Pin-like site-specific DNA recombinase